MCCSPATADCGRETEQRPRSRGRAVAGCAEGPRAPRMSSATARSPRHRPGRSLTGRRRANAIGLARSDRPSSRHRGTSRRQPNDVEPVVTRWARVRHPDHCREHERLAGDAERGMPRRLTFDVNDNAMSFLTEGDSIAHQAEGPRDGSVVYAGVRTARGREPAAGGIG